MLTCRLLAAMRVVSITGLMIGGPFPMDSSLSSWGRHHDRALGASRVPGRFWHSGHMSTSRLSVHSILAFLWRYTLGHMLGFSALSLELSWHSRLLSMLHWIASLGVRYATTHMMEGCWLDVRSSYYGSVSCTTSVLGFDVLGVLFGGEDLPLSHACLQSTQG